VSVSTIDSFASELARGDMLVLNSELWQVLEVGRTQRGVVHVYTDHDVLTLPTNALVEIAIPA
jgi:hypothetical protein